MGSACSSSYGGSSGAIDALTDDEVYTLIRDRSNDTAFRGPNDLDGFIANTVWRISQDAVVKATYSPTEAFMMSYVSSHTSIPIPKVRRILPPRASDLDSAATWIIMDYIPGNTLEIEWPRMSMWRRLCTIWSIRRYIRELRRVPIPNHDVPGPFDVSGKSYVCHGNYFTEDGSGPFHSYLDMAAWFDRRRFDVLAAIHSMTGTVPRCPKFDCSHPLVLCHMDLHMRNFLVDARGKLWLIDWANAGAFPPWLEYAHMAVWADAAREAARPPKSWMFFLRFMVGDYRRYKTGYLDKLRWAWDRPSYDFFPLDYFSNLGLTLD